MRRILPTLILAAMSLPALADPGTLNFENLPDGKQVLDSYTGFHFSDTAWSVLSSQYGGSGNFYGGAPGSERGVVTLFNSTLPSDSLTMRVDVAGGFGTAFSLSVATLPGTRVNVEAFDASGRLLQQALSSGADGTTGCLAGAICNWETLTLSLASNAEAAYVEMSAPVLSAWFDDMSFGALPVSTVPEPASLWLGMTALGALALSRRRFSRR